MVFISYNHKDGEFADRLALDLAKHNVKVWKDSWRMGVGDSLIKKIQGGLEGARFFCVIFSHNSLASPWVEREIEAGLLREIEDRKVMLLPVVIDDCKLPLLIRGKLYADFRAGFEAGLQKLLAVLLPHYRVQGGGCISKDDRYFLHFSANTESEDGRLVCSMEAVSFDLEETYSIRTQLRFQGAEGIGLDELGVVSLAEATLLVLEACACEFRARPAHVKVAPGKVTTSRFPLQDQDGKHLFEASVRVVGLGEFRRGAVAFNVGAIAIQVFESMAADSSKQVPG